MDKVLIVDEDQELLKSLYEGLDKLHQFEVMTAIDNEAAFDILAKKKISVLVTAIGKSKLDGLELVAYMTRNHQSTPIVVMNDYGKPWFREYTSQSDFLYHIEKPFPIKSLVSSIFVGLTLRDEGKYVDGMTLSSLMPIMEAQHKSCRMEVESPGKSKGFLYFDDGVLIDAHHRDLAAEKAASEITGWHRIKIKFSELPLRRKKHRVKTPLMDMVGATWQKKDLKNEKAAFPEAENKETAGDGISNKTPVNEILKRYILEFTTIKGYKAVAVLNGEWEILEYHAADEKIDLGPIVESIRNIFSVSTNSTVELGLDKCLAFTLHTQKCSVLTISSDSSSKFHFRLIGLCDPSGNWVFMQHKLERLAKQILAEFN